MLYRFREAQAAELGKITKKQKRPALSTSVDNVGECEKWRRDIMREISRGVSKIQDCKSLLPPSPLQLSLSLSFKLTHSSLFLLLYSNTLRLSSPGPE